MPTTVLLINGFLKVGIYLLGFAFAAYYRRGMLFGGFALAALVSGVRAIDDASSPHVAATDAASALGTIVAVLFVGSFVAAQTRGGRPRRWTP